MRQKLLPIGTAVVLTAALLLFFMLEPADPPADDSDADAVISASFEDAVIVGRREGAVQWELVGSEMRSDNGDLLIGSLEELRLWRDDGEAYRIHSTHGTWNASNGRLHLPSETVIVGDGEWQTEAGAFTWLRDEDSVDLDGGVLVQQERTIVRSQKAQLLSSEGVFVFFGDIDIRWMEEEDGE